MTTITQEQIAAITKYVQQDIQLHGRAYYREGGQLFDGGKIIAALESAGLAVEGITPTEPAKTKRFEVTFRMELVDSMTVEAVSEEEAANMVRDLSVSYQFFDCDGNEHESENLIDEIESVREVA